MQRRAEVAEQRGGWPCTGRLCGALAQARVAAVGAAWQPAEADRRDEAAGKAAGRAGERHQHRGRSTTTAAAITPTSARAGAVPRGHRPPGSGAIVVYVGVWWTTMVVELSKATHDRSEPARQQGGPNTRPRAPNCTGHRPMHPNCTPTPSPLWVFTSASACQLQLGMYMCFLGCGHDSPRG